MVYTNIVSCRLGRTIPHQPVVSGSVSDHSAQYFSNTSAVHHDILSFVFVCAGHCRQPEGECVRICRPWRQVAALWDQTVALLL